MTMYVLSVMGNDYYATCDYHTFACELSKDEVLDVIKAQIVILKKFEDENYPELPNYINFSKDGCLDQTAWKTAKDVSHDKILQYQRLQPQFAEAHLGNYVFRVNTYYLEDNIIELFTLNEWFIQQSLQLQS
jgi:hypothetical protein